MIVLDAQAVIAVLRDEPGREQVLRLTRDRTLLATVNLAEVVDQMTRISGFAFPRLVGSLGLLTLAGLELAALDDPVAWSAGRIRASHYHRTRNPLSLGDAVAAATALSRRAPLATADRGLAAVVRAEGGQVIALPDSAGRISG